VSTLLFTSIKVIRDHVKIANKEVVMNTIIYFKSIFIWVVCHYLNIGKDAPELL
jgi:hypothetical protein